eukprot:593874-Amphidinium_carterae.2
MLPHCVVPTPRPAFLAAVFVSDVGRYAWACVRDAFGIGLLWCVSGLHTIEETFVCLAWHTI